MVIGTESSKEETNVRRYAQVIRLRPESREEYVKYHARVWPEVLKLIQDCNIRNYSIFLKDDVLYAYFEYIGSDYEADMAKMAAHPRMQDWWKITDPMQEPLPTRAPGEWWAKMDEVFHTD
jgi:L-rhamnose mutarotase